MSVEELVSADEGGTYIVPITFTDEDGVTMVPDSVVWNLLDDSGNVVNSRSNVSITPATSVTVILSGDDLVYDSFRTKRYLTISGTYSGTYGSNLPIVKEFVIPINHLSGIGDTDLGVEGIIEQIPGNQDLRIVKGDDFPISFSAPFNASGFTFTTIAYYENTSGTSILTTCSVQSSILSIITVNFQASVTNNFTSISYNKNHSLNYEPFYWKMKYIDNGGLTRTFIDGLLEVL
jgi:hypothetical protein